VVWRAGGRAGGRAGVCVCVVCVCCVCVCVCCVCCECVLCVLCALCVLCVCVRTTPSKLRIHPTLASLSEKKWPGMRELYHYRSCPKCQVSVAHKC
jgi:hypothetical protein